MCHGFRHFFGLLHHFVFAKVATSSIRVKAQIGRKTEEKLKFHGGNNLNEEATVNSEKIALVKF